MTAAGSDARKMRSLGSLRSVLRSSLLPISNSDRIKRSANHVVTYTGQILYASATDQYNGVLLQVVANARDISRNLDSIRQTHARDFPQRRVRLLRGLRIHTSANSALLRTSLQSRTRRFESRRLSSGTNQLVERRHALSSSSAILCANPRTLSRPP